MIENRFTLYVMLAFNCNTIYSTCGQSMACKNMSQLITNSNRAVF